MEWFFNKKKQNDGASAEILRGHDDDLHRFAHAILTSQPGIEHRLSEYLKRKPERQRWAFLNKLRQHIHGKRDKEPYRKGFLKFAHVHPHEEEKALDRTIAQLLNRQEKLILKQHKKQVDRWIRYLMPMFNQQSIMRKEQFKEQMSQLGHELEAEGIKGLEGISRKELGELSADSQDTRQLRRSHEHGMDEH